MAVIAAMNTTNGARSSGGNQDSTSKDGIHPLTARERDTAQYIAEMILELRNMAKSTRLFQVMVPLEYAYYEAFSVANRVDVPRDEAERLHELSKAAEQYVLAEPDY